jgi:hypothetical protein
MSMCSVVAAKFLFCEDIYQILQSDLVLQKFACLYFKKNYIFPCNQVHSCIDVNICLDCIYMLPFCFY